MSLLELSTTEALTRPATTTIRPTPENAANHNLGAAAARGVGVTLLFQALRFVVQFGSLSVLARDVTLQGFGVGRYATSLPLQGAVLLRGGNATLRDLVVTQNATQGISFHESGNLADRVSATGNGMTGMHGNQSDSLTVRNSVIDGNNAQQFNPSPSAAGIKITRSRYLTFTNDEIDNNQATGLWLDQSDVNFTIAGNTVAGNAVAGIELELTDTGIVADNVISGTGRGLYVLDTGNVLVFNNSISSCSVTDVYLSQDERRQADPADYNENGDKRYPLGDPTDPWLTRNIVMSNNLFPAAGSGLFQIYALDKATHIPADRMNLTINGNDFAPTPTMLGWGEADNTTITKFTTPSALAAAKNPSWRNLQDLVGTNQSSSNATAAVPLPAVVAAAIGQPAGIQHLGPF